MTIIKRKPGGQFTTAESFWSRVEVTDFCWLWVGRHTKGRP